MLCEEEGRKKKRERDSLFPSSSTFYGLVKSHVSDRSVSLSMDPHSRKKPLPFPPNKKKNKKKLDGGVKQNKKKKKMCGGNVSKRSTFSSFFFISKEEKEDKNDETRPIPISLSLEYYSILISSRSVKRTRQRRDIVLSSQRKRKRKRHQTKRCDARQR